MRKEIKIGDCYVGEGHPTFIIAELSCNHLQKYDLAVQTIKAMKDTGVDAIKLQTDYNEGGQTIQCDKEHFRINHGTEWDGRNLYELYKEAETPWEWHAPLKKLIEDQGMICFSTPSCKKGVDFLMDLEMPAFKISSFELRDIPLIKYAASKMIPMIMSTGMATQSEIEEALQACKKVGNDQIILLKCTSNYPTDLSEVNLKTMEDMGKRFDVITGLSDHTQGIATSIASVALGGSVIEKHVIIDKRMGGPDETFSIEPEDFTKMVKVVRDVERSLGKVTYELTDKIKKMREMGKSAFIVEDVKAGDVYDENNLRSIRPGYGLAPKYLEKIWGTKAVKDVERGTPLSWDMTEFEGENVESKNVESKNVESKNVESKNVESKNVESKNVESERIEGEN